MFQLKLHFFFLVCVFDASFLALELWCDLYGFVILITRIEPMRYIRRWKIKDLWEDAIKMQLWLLASTLPADKKISLVLWKVWGHFRVRNGWLVLYFLWAWELLNLWVSTEICSAVSGASKKEIGRAKEFIWKHLEVEIGQEIGSIHAGDYLVSLLHELSSLHTLRLYVSQCLAFLLERCFAW